MADKDQNNNKQLAAAMRRLERMKVAECFDPISLDSRPTAAQQAVLEGISVYKHRYVRASNQSGKTQIGAREVAWFFEENHPHWTRPADWGSEALVILVIGRVSKQVEEVLWRKIKSFLDLGQFQEVRQGGALQKVVSKKNGNTIIFGSHHSDNEAREKLQAYVAHYVWIDEMPGSVGLMEELHRRVQARNGYFLATFTPKVRNEELRRFVDSQTPPLAHCFRLRMFDNPLYAGREAEILSSMTGLTEAYRNTILYGDWLTDDNTVYQFDSSTMVVPRMPENYSPSWRHIEAVDPALKSKFGFILLAEEPLSGNWYVVKADYIQGIYVPTEVVTHVEKQTKGYNVIRRISDPHEVWYIQTANSMRIQPAYMGVYDKSNRKSSLMKNLQESLGQKLFICSWCTDLIDEFQSMRWSEDSQHDKIVNGSSYHLIDALQYGIDNLPKPNPVFAQISPDMQLLQAHEKRLMAQAEKAKQTTSSHWKKFTIKKSRSW